MTSAGLAMSMTGEQAMGKYTGGRDVPSHEEIARVAYELYELRGRSDGHDVEDWLSAEQELTRHYR